MKPIINLLIASATLFAWIPRLPAQAVPRHIYSETADPQTDINAALLKAKREHKRVLIDIGGDWCGDCQVLDIYFRQSPNSELLQKNFVLVHIFTTSTLDQHVAVAAKYGVPTAKGVPALSVLDSSGKVIHAQGTGEFNDMRHMDPASVTEFLNRWKA